MSPTPTTGEPIARVGNFELVRLLGEGSMGRVFEARHTRLDRTVAIKMLRPEQASAAERVQRFFQEARTVNRINHPHIVEIHDFIEDRDEDGRPRAYCVMEYLAGETLSALLAREPLPLSRALRITDQVCRALAAAHGVGVIHRDIKPDNILIARGPDGRDFAKVLDFGVAKLVRPDPAVELIATHEGAIVGTPRYMSPEQAASLEVDLRADIYGVGCLLYEMISGRSPFDGEAFAQLAARILTQAPEPLGGRSASGDPISPDLEALVMQCLEKDPARRPQSLEEVRARLERAAGERQPHRRSFPSAFVASAGLVAVALIALALRPVQGAPEVSAAGSSGALDSVPVAALPPEAIHPSTAPAVAVPQGETTAPEPTPRPNATRKASLRSRTPGGRRSVAATPARESRDAVLNPFLR